MLVSGKCDQPLTQTHTTLLPQRDTHTQRKKERKREQEREREREREIEGGRVNYV